MSLVSRRSAPLLGLALFFALAGGAEAQPFGAWLTLAGPTSGYIQVPSSADLNPASAITVEAWVNLIDANGGACSSIVGKKWTDAWFLGICGTQLRSYIRGYDSTGLVVPIRTFRDAGRIPPGQWTHIAVTFDGTTRKHYINGELVGSWVEPGPLTATADPVRIGSDVAHMHTPAGAIDEVRLWNYARTEAQLRASLNGLTGPTSGLVALWGLNASAVDAAGGHNGALAGSGGHYFTFPVAITCGSSTASSLCLDGRFAITARYRVGAPGTPEGNAMTAGCANPGSGLFWFFSPDNWEVMVKIVNACALNSRYWVFSAATTNVFYRLEVFDIRAGVNKIYFNYPGPPAPAVTDTGAFATCP
ncbi:MAG TPA: LamG domain-containing protein [Thermoanaerobaculia bacterium]|nr:LamG domain-containing protein [Thermoanaerobaculia bacterium]